MRRSQTSGSQANEGSGNSDTLESHVAHRTGAVGETGQAPHVADRGHELRVDVPLGELGGQRTLRGGRCALVGTTVEKDIMWLAWRLGLVGFVARRNNLG